MKTFMAFITRILNRESAQVKENVSPAPRALPKPFYKLEAVGDGSWDTYYHKYFCDPYSNGWVENRTYITRFATEFLAREYIENLYREPIIIPAPEDKQDVNK